MIRTVCAAPQSPGPCHPSDPAEYLTRFFHDPATSGDYLFSFVCNCNCTYLYLLFSLYYYLTRFFHNLETSGDY